MLKVYTEDGDIDYEKICEEISPDENIKKAVEMYYGIRILKQEPWEALCSFIISQNNNIPRISGIIDRLCKLYGEENEKGEYTFPTYEKISSLTLEDLVPLKAGFRNKYILDAAQKLNNKEIDLQKIYDMTVEEALEKFFNELKEGVSPFYLYVNVTTPETLRKVLANPEKYAPSGVYIMRIHGTFVNFLDLSPEIQQDIITRLDPQSTTIC